MKIEIEEEEDTILVKVRVKPIHRKDYNVKVRIQYEDVIRYLSEKKVKVGECIKNPGVVTNRRTRAELSGEWVFQKPKPEKPVQTRKKVKKTLDKPDERVIIEVQEKTLSPTEE
jgi:hypothetical protein